MTIPLYNTVRSKSEPPSGAHKGLWFERFFAGFNQEKNWEIPPPDSKNNTDHKRDWINSVSGLCGDTADLQRRALVMLELAEKQLGKAQCYTTDWHFVTGMGLPHPVENGFAWHSTLAVPYLTGAAVKGLVRAWVEHWDDEITENQRQKRLLDWFGSDHKDSRSQSADAHAGAFIFFDALPVKRPNLVLDIMTPHMGNWYQEGMNINNPGNQSDRLPADWHDPVPVPFLATSKATFIFSIAPRYKEFIDELEEVFNALRHALDWLGGGAKTAVGYGHMEKDDIAIRQLESARDEARQAQREAAEEAILKDLGPEEQEIVQLRNLLEQVKAEDRKEPNRDLEQKRADLLRTALGWEDEKLRLMAAEVIEATVQYLPWSKMAKKKGKEKDLTRLRENP